VVRFELSDLARVRDKLEAHGARIDALLVKPG
jgi:hypothetical protein